MFAKQGYRLAYYVSIYAHDVALNFFLAVPVAIVIAGFRSTSSWPHVLIALSTSVIAVYWGMELTSIPRLLGTPSFWLPLVLWSVSLPLAFVAVRSIKARLGAT